MANEVTITVKGRDRGATKTIDAAGKSLTNVGNVAKGILAAGFLEQIGRSAQRFLGQAGQAASSLEQAVGGTRAVFGEASQAVDEFAKTSDQSAGLSERAFREATTLIGGQLKRMTGDVDFASDASLQLVQVGADLAATYGGTTKQAVDAFAAALRGEADPAERFNLNLKVSAVNAKAVELGLATTTSEVDENAKAQALLALVMEQSSDAQGQFARESDTAAGAAQRASAAWENAQAQLGQQLLPLLARGGQVVSTLAAGFGDLPGPVQATTGAVVLLSAAVLVLAPRVLAAREALVAFGLSARAANRSLGAIGIALTVAATAAGIFASTQQDAAESTNRFTATLDEQTGAVTRATREMAAQQLEQEGALQAAEELGVATRDLVGFVLGEAEAHDRVIAAMQRSKAAREGDADALDVHYTAVGDMLRVAEALRAELDHDKEAWERVEAATEGATAAAEKMPPELEGLVTAFDLAADDAETAAGKILEAWQGASEDFVDAIDAMNDASEDLREDQKLTKDMLLEQLREQVEAQQNWHDNMVSLAQRVPPAVFDELARLGPEGADLVQLLTTMSDKELNEYIELMGRKGRTAGGELISEVQANFLTGAPALRAIADQVGEEAAEKVAKGMRDQGKTVEQAARDIGLRIDRGVGGDRIIKITPVIQPTQGSMPGQFNASGGIVGGLATGGISGAASQAQAGGPRGGASVLMGEQGPEIAELPFGTRVVPSGQSQAMLGGGGGGGVVVNLFVQGSIRSDRDLVEMVHEELLNGGLQVLRAAAEGRVG